MRRLVSRGLTIGFAALFLCALGTSTALAQLASGFLKDYSQLEVRKDAKGTERRIWVNETTNWPSYERMLVDPVQLYPKPEGTVRVTLGTLFDIRDYLNAGLAKAVAASMPLAKEPGPGVLRLRSAITAVSVDKSLKPYQLIPIAMIVTVAQRQAGAASYPVKLHVESELIDSATGEVLARSVREAQGVEVRGDEPVTLSTARPQLDLWLAGFQEELALRARKPTP